MREHLVFTGGKVYRLVEDQEHDILDWLTEAYGAEVTEPVQCLSTPEVVSRLGLAALPDGFPSADVVIGSGRGMRGWLPMTVAAWEAAQAAVESAEPDDVEQMPADPAATAATPQAAPAAASASQAASASRAPWWTGVSPRADALVAIVTSRGVVRPSGEQVSKGPLTAGTDLGRWVWYRWPRPPAKPSMPQIWLTGPALQAIGMSPPKTVQSSEDLSRTVAALFGCTITSAKAGWFTASFPPASGTGEARRVHLVLTPFLWTDPSPSRPRDLGLAGTDGTETELPDDETAAVRILAGRIAWLASLADTSTKAKGEPALLPARRPGAVGAALLERMRRRETAPHRLEPCPLPTRVFTENAGRLEPAVDWRQPHPSKKARGASVDVEVDQRAAYLASASVVYLGHGAPEEFSRRIDPGSQFGANAVGREIQPAFGLWRITTPAGGALEGMDPRLPLPLPQMSWDDPATFWCTTRSVQQLLAPVTEGGAGMVPEQLDIDSAWIWPGTWRCLRAWSEILRVELKAAIDADDQARTDYLKNVYKSFIGRLDSSEHPPGQRHFQQPAWAATIRADTRWRALRYARRVAEDHGLYPLAARDIDTWVYRVPGDFDVAVLDEAPPVNGKYRVKAAR